MLRRHLKINPQASEDEYTLFIDGKLDNPYIDAIISQYLLGLGEFELGEFDGDE